MGAHQPRMAFSVVNSSASFRCSGEREARGHQPRRRCRGATRSDGACRDTSCSQVAGTTPWRSASGAGTAHRGFSEGSRAWDSYFSTRCWHLGQRRGIIVCLHVRCGSRVQRNPHSATDVIPWLGTACQASGSPYPRPKNVPCSFLDHRRGIWATARYSTATHTAIGGDGAHKRRTGPNSAHTITLRRLRAPADVVRDRSCCRPQSGGASGAVWGPSPSKHHFV